MGADIAVRAREIRKRLRPRARIGRAAVALIRAPGDEVGGDGCAGEEPGADARGAQLEGVNAPAVGVEVLAEGGDGALDAAAGVAVGAVVAVCGEGVAGLFSFDVAHAAAVGGVQGHLVAGGGGVDGLEDVDFAVGGPVGLVGQPERGPGGAAVGRVCNVEDEEAVVVSVH